MSVLPERRIDLTTAEKMILQYLANGYTRAEIARLRGCTLNSATEACQKIRRKLDAANNTHAVAIAMRNGLIQ